MNEDQSYATRKLKEAVTVLKGERSLVSYDPLQQYLSEIRRNPLLSREQEKDPPVFADLKRLQKEFA